MYSTIFRMLYPHKGCKCLPVILHFHWCPEKQSICPPGSWYFHEFAFTCTVLWKDVTSLGLGKGCSQEAAWFGVASWLPSVSIPDGYGWDWRRKLQTMCFPEKRQESRGNRNELLNGKYFTISFLLQYNFRIQSSWKSWYLPLCLSCTILRII